MAHEMKKLLTVPAKRRWYQPSGDILTRRIGWLRSRLSVVDLHPGAAWIAGYKWTMLLKHGFDVLELQQETTRMCPYLQQPYSFLVPLIITGPRLAEETEQYQSMFSSYMGTPAEFSWFYMPGSNLAIEAVGAVARAMLGSGFTSHTREICGSSSLKPVQINFEGDYRILCAMWIWHSK